MAQTRKKNGIALRISGTGLRSADPCSTESILGSVAIAPDYLVSGAIITTTNGIIKSGTTDAFTIKLYWNTSASLSGALQMGTYSVVAANTSPNLFRRFVFDSATTAKGMASTFSATNDSGDIATTVASYTFSSWLINGGYFFITGLRTSGTETLQLVKMTIEV
jgi:hypothetical protein